MLCDTYLFSHIGKTMNRIFFIRDHYLVFFLTMLLISPNALVFAKEDTAHLSLKKTAVSQEKTRSYTVKKGEWLFDIMRNELGITSHRFSIIKKLNPQLRNLNAIYPGQIIKLPEKDQTSPESSENPASENSYRTKKGDSLTRIAMRQLNAKSSDILKTVRQLKTLNPDIKDLNRIYPGHVLHLPQRSIVIAQKNIDSPQIDSTEAKKSEQKEKLVMPPENRLDVIKDIITRMNGSLVKVGMHYIPIPQMGQVTIDCSMIPVAELDDGSTILIDFTNRVPDSLKKLIQANWKNYRVVKPGSDDSLTDILQKIINASDGYTMTKSSVPLVVGKNPTARFDLDWIISKTSSGKGEFYKQGLIFHSNVLYTIPNPFLNYARKNGLIVTEITDLAVVNSSGTPYTGLEIAPSLPSASNKEMAHTLLLMLGYTPVKDANVRIFDPNKDGFNLSITADLLVKKGERSLMIHSKQLPQQFIDALNKNMGIDTLLLDRNSDRKTVIENVIQSMHIPCTIDNFSFPEPGKIHQSKSFIFFPAFKIAKDKGFLYLIDFDMDRDLYEYLHNHWEVNLVKF